MKTIIIKSELDKTYCRTRINETALDGKQEVVFKKVDKSATYKQQQLWFLWCGEVGNSGLGRHIIQNDVHISAKWQFVRPILIEEDEIFAGIYNWFVETYRNNDNFSELCKEFSERRIRTNDLTRKGRVKSLNEFYKYWRIEHGVSLTNPDMRGLDLTKF